MNNYISVDPKTNVHDVSPLLYGLFVEDINYTCDGGLNANLLANNSFDGVFVPKVHCPGTMGEAKVYVTRKAPAAIKDGKRWWVMKGKTEVCSDTPLNDVSDYLKATGKVTLINYGYNDKKHFDRPAISIKRGGEYAFDAWLNAEDFKGKVSVWVETKKGKQLTSVGTLKPKGGWQQYHLTLKGDRTEYGRFVLQTNGTGSLLLDELSFMDTDTWHAGDPKWSQGKLRKDLVEILQDLHATCFRFPGGCITEGLVPENRYNWKDTVGPLETRVPNYNLWGMHNYGEYTQSFAVGFYEWLCLAEDLNMEPLPILWGGQSCQMRTNKKVPLDSDEFQTEVIDQFLDFIDYCKADPKTNKWAKLRADAGHPAPFDVKYIGFGNENWGDYYMEVCRRVYKAVKEKDPSITLIISASPLWGGKWFKDMWDFCRKEMPDVLMDEHYYNTPKWYYEHVAMYDSYDRTGPAVFAGEYAASGFAGMTKNPNRYETALSEAALMTGFERNSDIVKMTAYAPTFSYIDSEHWAHNMINFNPAHILRTFNYMVQHMYMNAIGTYVPGTEMQLEDGIYSSVTADEKAIYVKLVNSNDHKETVTLDFEGMKKAKVAGQLLHSDKLEVKNTMTFEGEPKYIAEPEDLKAEVKDGKLDVELPKYAVCVLKVKRA